VTFDHQGERSFSFARKPGADTQLHMKEVNRALMDEAKVFHFGTLSLTQEPVRSTTQQCVAYAKQCGKQISFDPNLRLPLWHSAEAARESILWGLHQADVVKISDEEVEFLFGLGVTEGAQHILDHYGVKLVFVTCGPDGCFFKNKNAEGHVPSLRNIKVIDTTGAGDIFGGSAVWKLLQYGKAPEALTEAQLRDVVTFACTSAGLSTTASGGISSVPEYAQVLAAMGK
jgi:fructokinase